MCLVHDERHPERTGRWVLHSYTSAWNVFRSLLQDDAMRDRINCLIDSITDPFLTEIRYHWLKYVGQYQKMSVEEKLPLMHDVTYRETQTMFIDHHTPGLLREYKSIMWTYGLPNLGVQSSYVLEFGYGISPQERIRVKLYTILVAVAHTLKLSFHYWISEKQENFPGPHRLGSLSRKKKLPLF